MIDARLSFRPWKDSKLGMRRGARWAAGGGAAVVGTPASRNGARWFVWRKTSGSEGYALALIVEDAMLVVIEEMLGGRT